MIINKDSWASFVMTPAPSALKYKRGRHKRVNWPSRNNIAAHGAKCALRLWPAHCCLNRIHLVAGVGAVVVLFKTSRWCTFSWLARSPKLKNVSEQRAQLYTVWVSMCFSAQPRVWNTLWHRPHENGARPVCTRLCRVKAPGDLNDLGHFVQ